MSLSQRYFTLFSLSIAVFAIFPIWITFLLVAVTVFFFLCNFIGDIFGFLPMIERFGVSVFEKNKMPDWITRIGIRFGFDLQLQEDMENSGPEGSEGQREYVRAFIEDLKSRPIAEQTKAANEQHYEVDTRFFDLVLGKNKKYSCALYPKNTPVSKALDLLDDAEVRMFELYAKRAQIHDGDCLRILDLGCGWGSLTLWLAKRFPQCHIVGLSNSKLQRKYILDEAKSRKLMNVNVLTGNIAEFQLPEDTPLFDRVISIEMFEHMKNYEKLLKKVSQFMHPKALLFIHIFVNRIHPYHFVVHGKPTDWMARYFFSGGTMPSDDLLLHFQDDVSLVDRWRVNGRHYSLTLEAWLQKMDLCADEVSKVLANSYGEENVTLWTARWRGFFIVCSELFNFRKGNEWFVSHYLFKKK